MQQFKSRFLDSGYCNTFTNVQRCLRLNDLSEIGDGTHRLSFEMIGLFSFRQWTVPETIKFMLEFLRRLGLKPDYVTVHPDKLSTWSEWYRPYQLEVRGDSECQWSDGNIGGYCTEFYIDGIEIGNIVNPLGTCIDVGFGLERLLKVLGVENHQTKLEILEETCRILSDSGVKPESNQSGYILKKLITQSILLGSQCPEVYFEQVRQQMRKNYQKYLLWKSKPKFQDRPTSFWWDSLGIDESKLDIYQQLLV